MIASTPIRIVTDAETIECTWGQFCAENVDGFDQDQLDCMAAGLRRHVEVDISNFMHCGSRCVLTRVQ